MFDLAKETLNKRISELEKVKTKKYFEKEKLKKRVDRIDSYLDLQKRKKAEQFSSLIYLYAAIVTGIGGIAVTPLFTMTVMFSILSVMKTKKVEKIKKIIEKKYKELSNQSLNQNLKDRAILLENVEKIDVIYDNLSNMIAKCKFYLQQVNDNSELFGKTNNIDDLKREFDNYFQSNQTLEEYLDNVFFDSNIEFHNDINYNEKCNGKLKQLKKAG